MATPHYVIQKVGGDFVTVRKDSSEACAGYTVGGVLLALAGLRGRGLFASLLTLGGAGMIYRGMTGKNPLCGIESFLSGGLTKAMHTGGPSHQHDLKSDARQEASDALEESSMESFPASDPPAHTANSST